MKEVGIKASRRRVRPGNGILFAATIILAVLFLAPVFFAIISAFKSNGEILKNPMSLPTTLYLKNFQDLFAQSDFVVLTLVSEVLIVFIVPMAAYAMERRRTRTTIFIYTYFLAGMMIPFHLYMFPLFKEMKMFGLFGNLAGPIACYISGSVAFGSLQLFKGSAVRDRGGGPDRWLQSVPDILEGDISPAWTVYCFHGGVKRTRYLE